MIRGFDAGRADRRIIIQKPTETRDGTYNQIQYDHTDVSTVWAVEVMPASNRSNEEIDAHKISQGRRTRFIVRYSSTLASIGEKWRVLHGSLTYEVTDVFVSKREGFIRIDGNYNGEIT